jgi:hypothetical protein
MALSRLVMATNVFASRWSQPFVAGNAAATTGNLIPVLASCTYRPIRQLVKCAIASSIAGRETARLPAVRQRRGAFFVQTRFGVVQSKNFGELHCLYRRPTAAAVLPRASIIQSDRTRRTAAHGCSPLRRGIDYPIGRWRPARQDRSHHTELLHRTGPSRPTRLRAHRFRAR